MFKKEKKKNPTHPLVISLAVFAVCIIATLAGWTYNATIFNGTTPQEAALLVQNIPRYILLIGIIGSISLFGIVLSLTSARKRALDLAELMTRSIEKEKHKLEAIFSSMGESLLAVANDGKILLMNQVAQTTLGIAAADAYGKKIEDILKLIKEGKALSIQESPVYKAMRDNDIARVYLYDNMYLKDKMGRIFPIVLSAVSLPGKKTADDISAIIVLRDISLEKAVEEAKTEFVSLAAHQLRMPLTTIRWYTEMLLTGDVGAINKDQSSYLAEIQESNQRMVGLVNQLLNVSRIRLGTFKITPTPTDVDVMIDTVIAELKPEITKKQMQMVKQYEKKEVEAFNADPDLLHVVIQNLISNAIKYTPEKGTVTISFDTNKDFIMKVTDTGYGIPKLDQEKIFTQLYRANNVKKKDVEGSGLGLFMVKEIVEQSGGSITFSSEENEGTTFQVKFPKGGMRKKDGTKSLS